jgi:hypothetical protein
LFDCESGLAEQTLKASPRMEPAPWALPVDAIREPPWQCASETHAMVMFVWLADYVSRSVTILGANIEPPAGPQHARNFAQEA